MAHFFASPPAESPPAEMSGELTSQALRDYAISLLARREYSASELRERCLKKRGDIGRIDEMIATLQKEGLQSDRRFAELFVRGRIARRQGMRRILSELKLKGVSDTLAKEALRTEETDWYALASEALVARFPTPPCDQKERTRRQRFLAGRGFDYAQIAYAVNNAWCDRGGN